MNTLIFIVNIVSYLVAIAGITLFIKGSYPKTSIKLAIVFGWFAVILHAWGLGQSLTAGQTINIGAANAFSLTILSTLLIILPNAKRHPDISIVLFILATVSLIVAKSYDSSLALDSDNPTLGLHIILSIIAYAILMLVGIQAAIIVLRHSYLKNNTGYIFNHLPPLMNMEKWLFQLMLIGSIILFLSLVTALPFADLWFEKQFVHRSVLSMVALIIFVTLLGLHYFKGLRGKLIAKYALIAFLILLVGVSGSRLIQEVIFNRT